LTDFKNIEYLRTGNSRQQEAYNELSGLDVFKKLSDFCPILTGTIPIGIDLPESDLDIICECSDHDDFTKRLKRLYGGMKGFWIKSSDFYGIPSTVAKFRSGNFDIEIFGQNIPAEQQNAYRHMLIEHRLLKEKGEEFRKKIIEIKRKGVKTEPAFARLLGLKGNPYLELLGLEKDFI